MITFKRILCPVDTSECSRAALQHAVTLARARDAELTAVWVRPTLTPPPALWPAYPPEFVLQSDEDRAAAEERLRTFVRETAGDGGARLLFREGAVVPEILQVASELPADLIVIGTHGLSGLEHLLLGSVAERVLRKAACPVLTIPRGARPRRDTGPLFKTILCAVDFSRHCTRAIEFALSLAQEASGRLVLVHVLEHFAEEEPRLYAHYNVSEFRRMFEIEAQQRLAALVPDPATARCDVETVVGHGRAHRELLRIAAERDADVMVVGVHGRNAIEHALFGSTTERVLHVAQIPVLTVPPVRELAAIAA